MFVNDVVEDAGLSGSGCKASSTPADGEEENLKRLAWQ